MNKVFTIILCCLLLCRAALGLGPAEVAVVYNADSPLSEEAMQRYVQVRGIPQEQVFGLHGLTSQDISRADFDLKVRMELALQAVGRELSWLTGRRNGKKVLKALVLMPDLPLRVREDPTMPSGKIGPTPGNSASLDAELMLLGADFPIPGPLVNPLYKKDLADWGKGTKLMAVCRLDGPDKESIMRMINDPIRIEKSGLWGWVVVDQGGPYKDGDAIFTDIVQAAKARHQALFHESSKRTLADTFPLMQQTIAYFGWYNNPASGPFRAETAAGFRFAPGAIAMHLHSYSGVSIKGKSSWAGALLDRGAAVTSGNVAEPTLGGCLNFAVFYRALLEGATVAEASLLATPFLSWQSIVLGDPLYRPFPPRADTRRIAQNPFVLWRQFCTSHGETPAALQRDVDARIGSADGPLFAEMLAWYYAEREDYKKSADYFQKAADLSKDGRDVTRARLLQLTVMMAAGQRKQAQKLAREWRTASAQSVFAPAITATVDVIDPPPPAPKKQEPAGQNPKK